MRARKMKNIKLQRKYLFKMELAKENKVLKIKKKSKLIYFVKKTFWLNEKKIYYGGFVAFLTSLIMNSP